ncbi:unnamed protein product [Auanema sp. JU1783]|nr:unnamed protein product [Auanema sp. JU1783]
MSSFQLVHFDGSIKRNRNQEAILKSWNERDQFLRSLEEKRQLRSKETKQKSAATVIQRCWKSYFNKVNAHKRLRQEFINQSTNTPEDVSYQMKRINLFYRNDYPEDTTRLITVCSNYLSICDGSQNKHLFPPSLKSQFIARVIQFLTQAPTSERLNIPLRFLEKFLTKDEVVLAAKNKYFEAFIHVLWLSSNMNISEIKVETLLTPRLKTFFDFLLLPFNVCAPETRQELTNYLLRDILSSSHLVCVITLVIPQLVLSPGSQMSVVNITEALLKVHEEVKDSNRRMIALYVGIAFVLKPNTDEEAFALFHLLATLLPTSVVNEPEDDIGKFVKMTIQEGFQSDYFINIFLLALSSSKTAIEDMLTFHTHGVQESLFEVYCEKSLPDAYQVLIRLFEYILSFEVDNAEKSFSSISRKSKENTLINSLKLGWVKTIKNAENFRSAISLCSYIFVGILRNSVDDDFDLQGILHDFISDFIQISQEFLELCLGLIDLAFPDDFWCSSSVAKQKLENASQWSGMYQDLVLALRAIFQKNNRVHFLPHNFWTSHNRQVVVNKKIWYHNRRFNSLRQRQQSFAFVRFLRFDKPNADESDSDTEATEEEQPSNTDLRNLSIIRNIPFVVPFEQRLIIFRDLLRHDKNASGIDNVTFSFSSGHAISVRRQHLYEDAFEALTPGKCPDLRQNIRVSMINWIGLDEIGQDGGGIFREFLSELLKTGFDPNRGLFKYTHDRFLYPNPDAMLLFPHNFSQHYYFLGRMVAKLIYEGLMMDMHFADFFLVQLLSTKNKPFMDLEHMKSYDPTIYSHLYDLLHATEEEIDALALDFSVTVDHFNAIKTVDLKPNGRNVLVTHKNRIEYVQLYVNYFLYKQIELIIDAMRAGVNDVINPSWLAMFDSAELQIIVSGVDVDIDVDDLITHSSIYYTGVDEDTEYIRMFWNVVKSLTSTEKALFLKFITGCSRPPIGGFRYLQPKIGIQVANGSDDLLPTSATCMNLFKIPKYKTRQILEDKLRYAINSGAGFELQ